MNAQLTKLLNWFDDKNSVLVALSGGVDSAFCLLYTSDAADE